MKVVFLRGTSYSPVQRHFCCSMYSSTTIYFITERQIPNRRTDRRQYHANSWSQQYDRLCCQHPSSS